MVANPFISIKEATTSIPKDKSTNTMILILHTKVLDVDEKCAWMMKGCHLPPCVGISPQYPGLVLSPLLGHLLPQLSQE